MALAKGSSVVTDTVYHDRFSHVPELNRFGANIKVDKNTAFIRGVDELIGAPVMSTDKSKCLTNHCQAQLQKV